MGQILLSILVTAALIIYGVALLVSNYWVSAVLTLIAAGFANPAAKFPKQSYKWTAVTTLILLGVILIPIK